MAVARILGIIAAILAALPVLAEGAVESRFVTTSRVVRAGETLVAADLTWRDGTLGGISHPDIAIGQEAKATLFPGRPIGVGDLGPPALVERNDIVLLRFQRGALLIETDARAIDRGAAGSRIRVMNLSTRATVVGRVVSSGVVEVGG